MTCVYAHANDVHFKPFPRCTSGIIGALSAIDQILYYCTSRRIIYIAVIFIRRKQKFFSALPMECIFSILSSQPPWNLSLVNTVSDLIKEMRWMIEKIIVIQFSGVTHPVWSLHLKRDNISILIFNQIILEPDDRFKSSISFSICTHHLERHWEVWCDLLFLVPQTVFSV